MRRSDVTDGKRMTGVIEDTHRHVEFLKALFPVCLPAEDCAEPYAIEFLV